MVESIIFPDSPVGRQLNWILDHAGPAVLDEDAVEERFAPSFLAHIPASQVIAFLSQLGPLKASTIDRLNAKDHALQALLRIDESQVQVVAKVEPEPPHRFIQLGVKTGPTLLEILDQSESAASPSAAVAKHFEPLAERLSGGGLIVSVVSRDDEETFAFGDAPTDGIFEIGSITKPFTGVLLAALTLAGELGLNDLVADHLPGVEMPSWGGRPFTFVDLATHSSGLPRTPPGFEPGDPTNPYADFTVDKLYQALARTELGFRPGAGADYSNFAFGLLGHALAVASGLSYSVLLSKRLCQPLGMHETFAGVPPEYASRRVDGHGQAGPVLHWDAGALLGAGGIESTIGDLAQFVRANLDPPESPVGEALALAQQPCTQRTHRHQMGLGWSLLERGDSTTVVWKNGGTGGFRSSCVLHSPTGVGVVALCSCSVLSLDEAALATLKAVSAEQSHGHGARQ